MRKYIILLLIVLGMSAAAAAAELSVSDTGGAKGATIKVPINMAGAANIGSMDINLGYDSSVLRAVGAEKGKLTERSLLQANTGNSGTVSIAVADNRGITGDGSVALVTFEVVGETGMVSPLILSGVTASDAGTVVDVPINVKSGTFSVGAEEAGGNMIIYAVVLIVLLAAGAFYFLRKKK